MSRASDRIRTWHEALKPYEQGNTTFLGEEGHWHAVRSSHGRKTGRQWVNTKIEDCEKESTA